MGTGRKLGDRLVEHPGVDIVSFTGSCEVGRWIAETGPDVVWLRFVLNLAARTRSLFVTTPT